jgi:hypothetical protein
MDFSFWGSRTVNSKLAVWGEGRSIAGSEKLQVSSVREGVAFDLSVIPPAPKHESRCILFQEPGFSCSWEYLLHRFLTEIPCSFSHF